MIEILTKALWITFISYLVFIGARFFYKKYLKEKSVFYFYFLSFKKAPGNEGNYFLRLESPMDDFEVNIEVLNKDEIVFTKNAHLKAGINRVLLSSNNFDTSSIIRVKSESQTIERSFTEFES